jgi:hypothetical protein
VISNYSNAVDYLHTVMDLMRPVWTSDKHPEVARDIEQSFKILTSNPFYEGERPKVN